MGQWLSNIKLPNWTMPITQEEIDEIKKRGKNRLPYEGSGAHMLTYSDRPHNERNNSILEDGEQEGQDISNNNNNNNNNRNNNDDESQDQVGNGPSKPVRRQNPHRRQESWVDVMEKDRYKGFRYSFSDTPRPKPEPAITGSEQEV